MWRGKVGAGVLSGIGSRCGMMVQRLQRVLLVMHRVHVACVGEESGVVSGYSGRGLLLIASVRTGGARRGRRGERRGLWRVDVMLRLAVMT